MVSSVSASSTSVSQSIHRTRHKCKLLLTSTLAQGFDANASFGAYIDDDEEEAPAAVITGEKVSKTEQVWHLLEQDNTLSAAKLARMIGCEQSTAAKARKRWKEGRP